MGSSEPSQEVNDQPQVHDQAKVTATICQQIPQWQRRHDMDEVKQMKENSHFNIHVKIVSVELSFTIICTPCGKKCCLYWKKDSVLLSNYTGHVEECCKKWEEIMNIKLTSIFKSNQ